MSLAQLLYKRVGISNRASRHGRRSGYGIARVPLQRNARTGEKSLQRHGGDELAVGHFGVGVGGFHDLDGMPMYVDCQQRNYKKYNKKYGGVGGKES